MKRKVTQQKNILEQAEEYLASLSLADGIDYSVHAIGTTAIRVDFYRSNTCIGFLQTNTLDRLTSELSFDGVCGFLLRG